MTDRELLQKVGSGARFQTLVPLFGSPIEAAARMGKLQTDGLVAYNLTTGYTLTDAGTKLTEEQIVEAGTFSSRQAGSRLPVPVQIPDAAEASMKKIEKQKEYMAQRARTRDRLRQLAQESNLVRRPLRSISG